MERRTPTYWDYIRVEDLLALQGGLEDDEGRLGDDEVVFIVVHQVYELWFKLILRQLDAACRRLDADPVPEQEVSSAVYALERVVEILRLAADHFRVIETLSTRDYLAFRDKLFPASGFQSAQMREIEIALGLEDDQRIPLGGPFTQALKNPQGGPSPALDRIEKRRAEGLRLKDVLERWLHRTPIQGSTPDQDGDDAVIRSFLEQTLQGHERGAERQIALARAQGLSGEALAGLEARYRSHVDKAREFLVGPDPRRRRIRAAALFIASYRELPLLAWPRKLNDVVLEVEQLFLIFRQRHARMVERVIGRRVGTGGSAGVQYLDDTALQYRVFSDLWAVRTLLLDVDLLPPVENPDFYGFEARLGKEDEEAP